MPECGVSTVASPPETVGLSRQRRREILAAYATPSNRIGAVQVLATLVPIGLIAMSSFKADRDIFSTTGVFSFVPTLANYQALWTRWGDFFFGLWNSYLVTVGATVLSD
jgi:ABC-type glycerol-3-phosphate transport system permease component